MKEAINDIAYEYDRYLKSIGAEEAEKKDEILEDYFKDMIQELTKIKNQGKGAKAIVKDLQDALDEWSFALNEALDEMERIEDEEEYGFAGYTDDFC